MLWNFLREEQGQDLIEYTLLIAFIVVAGATIYFGMRDQIQSIWQSATGTLTDAAGAASNPS